MPKRTSTERSQSGYWRSNTDGHFLLKHHHLEPLKIFCFHFFVDIVSTFISCLGSISSLLPEISISSPAASTSSAGNGQNTSGNPSVAVFKRLTTVQPSSSLADNVLKSGPKQEFSADNPFVGFNYSTEIALPSSSSVRDVQTPSLYMVWVHD